MKIDTIIETVVFDPRDFSSKYKNFHPRQDPLYFADLYSPDYQYTQYAECYAIDKPSLRIYKHSKHTLDDVAKLMKKHKWHLMVEEPFIRPKTILAKAAYRIYRKHPKRYWTNDVEPPIFTSIVCDGTDTFTGKQGRGIPERNPGHEKIGMNKRSHNRWEEGSLTGVFINLGDSAIPIREFHPKGNVLRNIKSQTHSLISMYRGY